MQAVLEVDREAFPAVGALRVRDPEARPDLDRVPGHHLGEFNFLTYFDCIRVYNICEFHYRACRRKY